MAIVQDCAPWWGHQSQLHPWGQKNNWQMIEDVNYEKKPRTYWHCVNMSVVAYFRAIGYAREIVNMQVNYVDKKIIMLTCK